MCALVLTNAITYFLGGGLPFRAGYYTELIDLIILILLDHYRIH